MSRFLPWALLAGLVLVPSTAMAGRHDPLTSDEIDQLREVALDPESRLKLYADFARLRFTAIETARMPKKPDAAKPGAAKPDAAKPDAAKPDAANPRSLHDLMEDFLAVYDELDENISMYEDRQADLRKAMKIVLLADNEFHARLEGLQHNLTPEEHTDCDFVLSSIVEAVTTGTAEHKKLLEEELVSFKNKKKK
jgi:hypothetical protein